MISIIYGDETYLIQEKLSEITRKNSDSNILKLDGSDRGFSIAELVDSCRSFDLFSNKQLIFVKDPAFLIKKYDENDINVLLDYCQKPNYETDLVFYTFDIIFNERLKVFKDIASNADVIKLSKLSKNEFFSYAKNIINNSNINIDKDAINILVNSVNFDLSLLKQNIEILKLYPDRVDSKALSHLITYSNEEDVFNLINALTTKQSSLAIKYANKLMDNDESILRLISTLASQLRFLYCVGYYQSQGKKTNEIMNILNVKSSYRIEKANESLKHIDLDEIEGLLSKLADLDYECKKDNDINDRLKLELFIVSMMN